MGECSILDEVQRAPDLLSYLQGIVDADRTPGRFLLTGSSQFELIEAITQSLAGRTSLLTLLPFSLRELQDAGKAPPTVPDLLFNGLFPPVYDRDIPASVWLQDYASTYIERDVREILKIRDTASFRRFVQLCAGRIGQLINISSLAADAGVTRITAQNWLNALEASHLIVLITPWATNLSKRLIKSPKLYFTDPGLAANLLGVREVSHIVSHPHRGALFENWVIMELVKIQCHNGQKPSVHFLRDKQGHELDAIVETSPNQFQAIEIKSGATIASDFFKGLDFWKSLLPPDSCHPWLLHGGEVEQQRERGHVLPWNNFEPLLSRLL